MSPTVAERKRELRKQLTTVRDPFALLAECIQRNEELEAEVRLLRAGKGFNAQE